MARSDDARRHVRRAYERARALDGVVAMWPVPALIAFALGFHPHVGAGAIAAATALALALAVAAWSGGSWRRGATAGVLAGLLPLVVPAVVASTRGTAHCAGCTPSVANALACAVVCVGASVLAGVAVGLAAARDRSPVRYTGAALATAAAVGLIACGAVGLGGSVGIVAGLVAGGLPTVALTGRRARPAGR